jgi:archaellum component FlaG (FlaF/FlaG flagellin family)
MKLEYILTGIILFIFMGVMTYTSHQLSNCQRDKAKQIATQQNTELKVKDEIIEDKKQVTIRKAINRSVPTSDNLSWLQSNRCKDCQS